MARTRQFRRHQNQRIMRKIYKLYKLSWRLDDLSKDEARLIVKKHLKNPTPCSCFMCGNQRHNGWLPNEEKRTLAERKAALREAEFYIDDLTDMFNM